MRLAAVQLEIRARLEIGDRQGFVAPVEVLDGKRAQSGKIRRAENPAAAHLQRPRTELLIPDNGARLAQIQARVVSRFELRTLPVGHFAVQLDLGFFRLQLQAFNLPVIASEQQVQVGGSRYRAKLAINAVDFPH